MSNEEPYCGMIIAKIGYYYQENIHKYISIPICSVGIILNLLNVSVFTRKTMNSPPNLIFAHLAFIDFLLLLFRTAELWISLISFRRIISHEHVYISAILYWYCRIITTTLQFTSTFLTVQLAAWRYIAVVHPLKERHWCNKKITLNVMISGYVICCVSYAIPYYLSLDIEVVKLNEKTYFCYISFERYPIMRTILGIVYGLVVKLLLPLVLIALTSRIIVTLLARKRHREQLSPTTNTRSNTKNIEMRQQTNKSTAILLAVVVSFFIAEFPKGMLWSLSEIDANNWQTCYTSLLDIFDTVTYINASITFIVYYTLSQQFRTIFKSLFKCNPFTIFQRTPSPLTFGGTEGINSGRQTSEV